MGLSEGTLFHVWAGRLQIEIRLAFELEEAGRELSTAATDPKSSAPSCSLHLRSLTAVHVALMLPAGLWPAWGTGEEWGVQSRTAIHKGDNRL